MKDMVVNHDVRVDISDEKALMADIFLPSGKGKYQALLSIGPYNKTFRDSNPEEWSYMVNNFPETMESTSGDYLVFGCPDPEIWVKFGYAVVRVNSQSTGSSTGLVCQISASDVLDAYRCIEWIARQKWSNGKVGMAGMLCYAMIQWPTAALEPPHLMAICPWDGAADPYRDIIYHGGIPSLSFGNLSYSGTAGNYNSGRGSIADEGHAVKAPKKRETGNGQITGEPEMRNDDTPDFSKIKVPLLSCGNWGSTGFHLRGNTEGFFLSSAREKWLEIHGGPQWVTFYASYGRKLMKMFFDHYLKGGNNGWERMPRALLWLRRIDGNYELICGSKWPLESTSWHKLYLCSNMVLSTDAHSKSEYVNYESDSDGITFLTGPLAEEINIIGPAVAELYVSSSYVDADLHIVLRVFKSDMNEAVFYDFLDPHTPAGVGWLRLSYMGEDQRKTLAWRPYHNHRHRNILPGRIYRVRVEILPTGLSIPANCRLGVSIRSNDYRYGKGEVKLGHFMMRGSGPLQHNSLDKNYSVRIYYGSRWPSSITLPFIQDVHGMASKGLGGMVSAFRFPKPF
ncbi:MAG: CocE/NonD family hydrolase [Nitrososphaerota archaeon]|nr:CocE/NonD family hydrolase [Nitrososphaerota archaeon]